MNTIAQEMNETLSTRGWKGRLVPVEHLSDLADAVDGAHERGLLEDRFYRQWLSAFSWTVPEELPEAQSLLILAVPTPAMRVHFRVGNERVPVLIPPTYVSYRERADGVLAVLSDWLTPRGYGLAKALLPLKTLAVRSGLAAYGRNNICFVPEMGSFLQLVGAFTDLPCPDDPWGEPTALDKCESCDACIQRCPTGAISEDRFIIRAERCLTFFNEGKAGFPDWIDPSWHHCLIGCMRCQSICPVNKKVKSWCEDRGEFSERETALLTAGTPLDELPEVTAAKVKALELSEFHLVICRNLRALVAPNLEVA